MSLRGRRPGRAGRILAGLLAGAAAAPWSDASRAWGAEAPRSRPIPLFEDPGPWAAATPPWRLPFRPWLSGQGSAGGSSASTTSALVPRSFETQEYRSSWFLGKISAAEAYAAGFTGKGVLVAVIDSGLDITHPEFTGRVSIPSRAFIPGVPADPMSDLDEKGGHGTHVAGIVGAARDGRVMHGVAYDATILPLRAIVEVDDDDDDDDVDGNLNDLPPFQALRYAAGNGVKVLNGSYGPSALPPEYLEPGRCPEPRSGRCLNPNYAKMPNAFVVGGDFLDAEYKAVKAAAKADIVLVFSAGNERKEQPTASLQPSGIGLYPYIRPQNHQSGVYRILDLAKGLDLADPRTYKTLGREDPRLAEIDMSDLQGTLIAVVATDDGNKIASYSNWCGVTFLWCLAAPGGDDAKSDQDIETAEILSTKPGGGYRALSGTSMASPVVAGGAAVLREAFPYMTARQIIEIILTTTDHIGPREIYGRGLFNLGRAARGPREFGAEGFAQSFDVNTQGSDSVWSNDIVGSGRLVKRGDGNLTLTGANTYAGDTDVLGGALTLHGSVTSHVTIGRAATLRGTGRIDAPLTVAGSLEPGAAGRSFGTFTVTGDASLLRSSTYRVDADRQGDHDRLAVGGTATLDGGTLEIVLADGVVPSDATIQVVTASGGRTGIFGRLRTNSISAFLDPRLRYAGHDVVVSFERNGLALASVETNAATKDVAEAVQALGRESRLHDAITRLDAASADRAFDPLSGELHAGATVVAFGNARLVQDTILGRLRRSGGEDRAPPRPATSAADRPGPAAEAVAITDPRLDRRRFTLWGEGFGSWGRVRARDDMGALDTSTGGFILGAEAIVSPAYRVGVAAGFTSTTFDVDKRLSTGTNESVFGALYGAAGSGPAALRMGVSYAGHDIATSRDIAFMDFADRTSASYDGSTLQAFGEVGHRFDLAKVQIEPFVGGSVLRWHADAFTENGGPAALVGFGRTYGLGTTTVGLRVEAQLGEEAPVTLRALLGWRRAYGDVEPAALLAFREGAQAFTTSGAQVGRDALVTEASLDWQAGSAIAMGVSYTGQISRQAQDHALMGNLSWRF